jgi:hypothetical protein
MATKGYTNDKVILEEGTTNTVNPHMQKHITIEEWEDLLHHTHEGLNSTGSGGTGSGGIINTDITNVINNMNTTINNMNTTINNMSTTIDNMQSQIDKLESYVDQDIQISDNDGTSIEEDEP